MMFRLLFLVLFALPSLYVWAQAPLVVSAETKRADLIPHMSILRDPGGVISVSEAANASDWQALAGQFNMGFTKDALWLRVEVERPTTSPQHEWIVEVNNAVLDDLRLFLHSPAGAWEEHRAGEDIPRDEWDIPYRNPVFRIDLAEAGQHTLWLRISSRNSVSAQITLWQPAYFGGATRSESLAYGLLLGAYLTMIIVHLFFWRLTREPVSGWYALYVIDSFFHVALNFGYLQQYTGIPGRISDVLLSLLVCVSIWIGAKMSIGVLELAPRMPRTSRWLIRSTAAISGMTALLSITVSYAAGMVPAQLAGFVEVVVLMTIALRLQHQGYRPAAFFLAAFGVLCVGVMIRVARNFMLLPPNFLTDNSFQIAAIAHMLVMNLAIINRYNDMKAAAALAQADALQLKTEHAETLEKEVAARTASLTIEIAQREKLESELRNRLDVEKQARQEQRDFVAMASHEFRTPLTIIDTSAQRIAGSEVAAATRERCSSIRKATRRMTRLMDEFLTIDRVDEDILSFTAVDEDTDRIVCSAADEWDRGSIQVACANLPPCIACDAGLLRIALRNLLANAVHHSPEGVAVQFRALGRVDGGVDFEVVDAGCGIPADEMPKLFQKYFRGRNAQHKPGAGLGLYLVERIAKLHGGTVAVTSSALGSRFVLTVPSNLKRLHNN